MSKETVEVPVELLRQAYAHFNGGSVDRERIAALIPKPKPCPVLIDLDRFANFIEDWIEDADLARELIHDIRREFAGAPKFMEAVDSALDKTLLSGGVRDQIKSDIRTRLGIM